MNLIILVSLLGGILSILSSLESENYRHILLPFTTFFTTVTMIAFVFDIIHFFRSEKSKKKAIFNSILNLLFQGSKSKIDDILLKHNRNVYCNYFSNESVSCRHNHHYIPTKICLKQIENHLGFETDDIGLQDPALLLVKKFIIPVIKYKIAVGNENFISDCETVRNLLNEGAYENKDVFFMLTQIMDKKELQDLLNYPTNGLYVLDFLIVAHLTLYGNVSYQREGFTELLKTFYLEVMEMFGYFTELEPDLNFLNKINESENRIEYLRRNMSEAGYFSMNRGCAIRNDEKEEDIVISNLMLCDLVRSFDYNINLKDLNFRTTVLGDSCTLQVCRGSYCLYKRSENLQGLSKYCFLSLPKILEAILKEERFCCFFLKIDDKIKIDYRGQKLKKAHCLSFDSIFDCVKSGEMFYLSEASKRFEEKVDYYLVEGEFTSEIEEIRKSWDVKNSEEVCEWLGKSNYNFLKEYIQDEYKLNDDQLHKVMSFVNANKNIKIRQIKEINNFQWKRLWVDISYVLEKAGCFCISGADLSLNPKKVLIDKLKNEYIVVEAHRKNSPGSRVKLESLLAGRINLSGITCQSEIGDDKTVIDKIKADRAKGYAKSLNRGMKTLRVINNFTSIKNKNFNDFPLISKMFTSGDNKILKESELLKDLKNEIVDAGSKNQKMMLFGADRAVKQSLITLSTIFKKRAVSYKDVLEKEPEIYKKEIMKSLNSVKDLMEIKCKNIKTMNEQVASKAEELSNKKLKQVITEIKSGKGEGWIKVISKKQDKKIDQVELIQQEEVMKEAEKRNSKRRRSRAGKKFKKVSEGDKIKNNEGLLPAQPFNSIIKIIDAPGKKIDKTLKLVSRESAVKILDRAMKTVKERDGLRNSYYNLELAELNDKIKVFFRNYGKENYTKSKIKKILYKNLIHKMNSLKDDEKELLIKENELSKSKGLEDETKKDDEEMVLLNDTVDEANEEKKKMKELDDQLKEKAKNEEKEENERKEKEKEKDALIEEEKQKSKKELLDEVCVMEDLLTYPIALQKVNFCSKNSRIKLNYSLRKNSYFILDKPVTLDKMRKEVSRIRSYYEKM